MTTRLFVYGSLRRGQPNHAEMAGARFVRSCRSAPRWSLIDLGDHPALVPGESAIVGEVYEVEPRTLGRIDILEGVPQLYVRVSIELDDGSEAEAYVLAPGFDAVIRDKPRIESGDWCAR